MKTVIVAVNSRFIHSMPAPWYLKANCGGFDIKVLELNINQNLRAALAAICEERPDVAAFSCYIFNIEYVQKLISDLKRALPGVIIVLGGPEVSFDCEDVLKSTAADYVIAGEGERAFGLLLAALRDGRGCSDIAGLCGRTQGKIFANPPEKPQPLDEIKSPYTDEMLASCSGRILYYESSRGCPFSCAYCLSGGVSSVRFLPLERVKAELGKIFESDVRQVKFVDRTFNCNMRRAARIIEYIIESAGESSKAAEKNYHFEMGAEFFDDELFAVLEKAPAGLIQFEIGVQSTNEQTLAAVSRAADWEKARRNIERLIKMGNIHIHVDLIAGLPHEDIASFARSLNDVYSLRPHQLQLGFLKLLKGSLIRARAFDFGCVYSEYPPYEVIATDCLSFADIALLKDVEEMVERYYNAQKFAATLRYIESAYSSPFEMYKALASHVKNVGYFELRPSFEKSCELLRSFAASCGLDTDAAFELLRFDTLLCGGAKGFIPFQDLHAYGLKEKYLECIGDEFLKTRAKELLQMNYDDRLRFLHLVPFKIDVFAFLKSGIAQKRPSLALFDHSYKHRVTGHSRVIEVEP